MIDVAMKVLGAVLLSLLVPVASAAGRPGLKADRPKECESCAGWNAAYEPFRIFGNTYYVGVAGLSSVLVASDEGLILLDGGLPQSAPLIDANIRRLGFRTEDIRLIVNSHAHFDHAGGIAALQRVSGAIVAASASGARAMEGGEPPADDPQSAFGKEANRFPPVKRVRVVADGQILRVGTVSDLGDDRRRIVGAPFPGVGAVPTGGRGEGEHPDRVSDDLQVTRWHDHSSTLHALDATSCELEQEDRQGSTAAGRFSGRS